MNWHDTGVTYCLTTREVLRQPCPAWPVWREQIRIGLTRLMMLPKREPPRPAPTPQLLAVIPSGTSVEETIPG